MSNQFIYALAEYIKTGTAWPNGFDFADQFIVGGSLPSDPVECILMKESGGGPISGTQDRQDITIQFLARAEIHSRSRELIYAVFDSDALTSRLQPDGPKFHEIFDFTIQETTTGGLIRIAKLGWVQTPFDLGATGPSSFAHSVNAIVTMGNG